MPWKLKIDEESKLPVFQDPEKEGDLPRPIYINSEDKEVALDPVGMYDKIITMGKTEKELRGTTKRLEGQLELFTDIEDITEWKTEADKALETVANFNDKEWMDVKKVEKLKVEMKEAHDKQITQMNESFSIKEGEHGKVLQKKDGQLRKLMVSNKFATHPLFSGSKPKTSLPPEIAETYFGKHFKVEEGDDEELKLNAYDEKGDQVYSHENPGEPADFAEAMSIIFEKYPGKDALLRSTKGTDSRGGNGDDDTDDGDEIKKLQKEYDAAIVAKDSKTSITLKNKIFRLQQAKKGVVS